MGTVHHFNDHCQFKRGRIPAPEEARKAEGLKSALFAFETEGILDSLFFDTRPNISKFNIPDTQNFFLLIRIPTFIRDVLQGVAEEGQSPLSLSEGSFFLFP